MNERWAYSGACYNLPSRDLVADALSMDAPTSDFVHAASLEELKAKTRLVVRGRHRPILLVYENGRVFALDNRCPHMGFPLDRGSIEDGILTCHWHHARFEVVSGCTFDCGLTTCRPARSKSVPAARSG